MECHILYLKSRKSFEMRRQKNFTTLSCAKIKHTTKSCVTKKHTSKYFFAVCQKKHMAKDDFADVN